MRMQHKAQRSFSRCRRRGLLTAALILVAFAAVVLGAIGVLRYAMGVPIVHIAPDGACVRVLMEEDDGRLVERKCSVIDLTRDRYEVVHVASPEEAKRMVQGW